MNPASENSTAPGPRGTSLGTSRGTGRRRTVAAVDLGAESGRVTTVTFDGQKLSADIVNRFPHTATTRGGILRWDVSGLWANISAGLGELSKGTTQIDSIGVDTWGVDYGLLDAGGQLLDDPVCYRDERTHASYASALASIGPERLYAASGVQLMPINTLFALMADMRDHSSRLTAAHTLLMMPDVFHHKLSGARVSEYTAVSTTGCFDMAAGHWAIDLLDELGIPTHMLPEVVPPGTDVGPLTGPLSAGSLTGARVILPPGHDTASAVVGTPLASPGGLYLSSGTWSLAGIETATPLITPESQAANLTNEGGYAGTFRLLRNVMGLWILQECRREWHRQGIELSYSELATLAASEPGLVSFIVPDSPEFLAPGDMPSRVRAYCARHGFPVPETIGALARCVIDSLALSYCAVVDDLEKVTGIRPPTINIVGGGSRHSLLSQLTADATGLTVFCGPVEATALGNGATQLAALGEFASPAEIRQAIADSTEITCYEPHSDQDWPSTQARYNALRASDALV